MLAIALLVLGILLLCVAIGSPVSTSMGIPAVAGILAFLGAKHLVTFGTVAFTNATNPNNLVIPSFILMAEFLSRGGIAGDIYYVLNKYMKRIKGGLALSTMLACTVFAALCGSSPATAVAVGRVAVDEMIKRGYDKSFAVGTVAAGGTLGIMIPPSVTFVMFGILTETSIVKLLIAGVLPGLMLSALMCIAIVVRVRLNPTLVGEREVNIGKQTRHLPPGDDIGDAERKTTVLEDIKLALPALSLIALVLGSLYTGAATPTESAGFGAVGALILVLARKRLTKKHFAETMWATAKSSAMMILMLTSGLCLTQVVSRLKIATVLCESIIQLGLNKWTVMISLYVLWYFLGCIMSPTAMVVLTIPFIFPTLVTLGFDPLWIGVVSTLCVEVGMITPPVGLNLFILNTATGIDMTTIIKGALPYVVVLTIGLIMLTVFPQISLLLPSTM